jgi:hypothetical protein
MKNPIKKKTKLTAIIAITLLSLSTIAIMLNTSVKAQDIQSGDSEPLPPGVTPDYYIDTLGLFLASGPIP